MEKVFRASPDWKTGRDQLFGDPLARYLFKEHVEAPAAIDGFSSRALDLALKEARSFITAAGKGKK